MWHDFNETASKPFFPLGKKAPVGWVRNGFTLLEVMIAIAILASMSMVLFAVSTEMMDSQDLTEARDEAQHSISFAFNKMSQDLNSAYILKSKALLGSKFEGELNFIGTDSRIDFVSFSHLRFIQNAKESDSVELSYYLQPDPDTPNQNLLMRRQSTSIDKDLEVGGRAYPLLSGVQSMRLEYLPANSDEWKKEWNTKSADAGGKLPRAVKIELEVELPDEVEPKTYSIIAPIRLQNALAF